MRQPAAEPSTPLNLPDASLSQLVKRAGALCRPGQRTLLGITGGPGAGKSTLAEALVQAFAGDAALLPMDGFHLADEELIRLGRHRRKGAIDTFDAAGYVHALRRVRERIDPVVYVPRFAREQELAIAGALPLRRETSLIITEGNYLLADGAFEPVRGLLTECWYLTLDPRLRRQRLIDRHIRHGRSREAAEEWVDSTDEPNAAFIDLSRTRADVIVSLTGTDRY
jgi:pantothenate kinase